MEEIKIDNKNNVTIKIKYLTDQSKTPIYAHDGDVGMDLTATSVEYDETIDTYIYHTGITIESEKGYGAFIFPRSSNRKTDYYLANSVGIVDTATYRGEILVCFKCRISTFERMNIIGLKAYMQALSSGKTPLEAELEFEKSKQRVQEMTKNLEFAPYKVGDKVAQMVVMEHPKVVFENIETLSETSRQDGGFGSSGN